MYARLAAALLVAAIWAGPASAAGPVDTLVKAVERSNSATTASMSLVEHVKAGGKTVTTLRMSGVERPRAGVASFRYSITPAQPGVGSATILTRGSRVYIHYASFDKLAKLNPRVKKWLFTDTNSSLGLNPAGLSSLGTKQLRAVKGLKVVGSGTEGGVPVTRYRGTLALAAVANSAQLQGLFASMPSEVRSLLQGDEQIEVAVGKDGYAHRVTSLISASLSDGTKLSITIEVALSDFNKPIRPIVFPPRSEVMTLEEFQEATGTGTSSNDVLLDKLALGTADVGAGYSRSVIPGGKLVEGETTLDFCELKYPSESLRSARLQVVLDDDGSRPDMSNEVVIYDAGGAGQALREVRKAISKCPTGRVANAPSGVKNFMREVRTIPAKGLLPGAIAIVMTESATVKGKHVEDSAVMVYQTRGNVLSAIYARGNSLPAAQQLALHAAAKSAAKLRTNVEVGDVR